MFEQKIVKCVSERGTQLLKSKSMQTIALKDHAQQYISYKTKILKLYTTLSKSCRKESRI